MNFLSTLFAAIGGLFSWASGRSAQRNAPEMQANAAARTDVGQAASATGTVAAATRTPEGLAQLQKEASE